MNCLITDYNNCPELKTKEVCNNCNILGCHWNEVAVGSDRCRYIGSGSIGPIIEEPIGDNPIEPPQPRPPSASDRDVYPNLPSNPRNRYSINVTNNNITGDIDSIDNLKPAEYNIRQRRNLRHRKTNSDEIISEIPYLTYNNPYIKIISLIGLLIVLLFLSYYLIKKKYI